jgi:hypothetical protein
MSLAHYEHNLQQFRNSLSHADQAVLDDLLEKAGAHAMAERVLDFDLPHMVRLLSLLIEMHKEVARLRREVEEVGGEGISTKLKDFRPPFFL